MPADPHQQYYYTPGNQIALPPPETAPPTPPSFAISGGQAVQPLPYPISGIDMEKLKAMNSGPTIIYLQAPVAQPVVQPKKRDWTYGLFTCCGNPGIFCCAYFCPWHVVGWNMGTINGQTGCCRGFSDCCTTWCIMACCPCLTSCVTGGTRTRARGHMNIQGDSCKDICIHLCCHACALTQEYREIHEQPQPQTMA